MSHFDSICHKKKCFKCGKHKFLATDFYKHPQMGDGYLNKCKECTKVDNVSNRRAKVEYYREYDRERNKTQKRRDHLKRNCVQGRKKYPEKMLARAALLRGVKAGLVKKYSCMVCGREDSHGHHWDYSKPLDVIWLCPVHHANAHGKGI